MNVGSLFTGIGGFDLGLERAGMRVVWQCEQDPYCRRVLARHWPGVPCHPDVRTLVADTADAEPEVAASDDAEREQWASQRGRAVLAAGARAGGRTGDGHPAARDGRLAGQVSVPVPHVDVLAGGFPCQDLSYAGQGAGITGARSGLWTEYARLIRELRPRYVIVENVPALLARGMGVVLGDLAACGYDAEWDCIPAQAVGAPHRRDRVWIVAYPARDGAGQPTAAGTIGERARAGGQPGRALADANGTGSQGHGRPLERAGEQPSPTSRVLGDPDGMARPTAIPGNGRSGTLAQPGTLERALGPGGGNGNPWESEPDVGRVAHGIPNRLHGGGDAHPNCIAEARAEGASDDDLMRAMRQHLALAAASHGPATCGVCGDPVSDLPRHGGLRGRNAETTGAEDLRRLQERLHGVHPLKGEDLLAGVPVGTGSPERAEAMGWWDREPDVGRVAHGVPHRVDRLRALGNALVPQIAEWIGRRIIDYEQGA